MAEKYIAPEGMLKAADGQQSRGVPTYVTEGILQAAIGWFLPKAAKAIQETIYDCFHSLSQPSMSRLSRGEQKDYVTKYVLKELRRMFIAPEPEVPEEVKPLLVDVATGLCDDDIDTVNSRIIEAYNRGLGNSRTAQKGNSDES